MRQAEITAPESGISALLSVVYWCYSVDGELLYIGCTGSPVVRMRYHYRLTEWFKRAHWIATSEWMPRQAAFDLESYEIALRKPSHNIKRRAAA